MGVKFANNAYGTLNASITSSDASLTLSSGQGARFPSLGAGDYFYVTLIDTSNNLEIAKCTARSSDVLTITRGQEGTTARSYSVGDRVELRITSAALVAVYTEAVSDAASALDGDKGDITVSSSGTVWNLDANVVGANELNVSGNGTSGQALLSDGDGTMSWGTAAATDFYYKLFQSGFADGGPAHQSWTIGQDMPQGKYMLFADFNWDARNQADPDSSEYYWNLPTGSGTLHTGYYRQYEQALNGGTANNHLNGTCIGYVNITSSTGRVGLYFNPVFDGMSDTDSGGWGGEVSIMIFSLD